MWSCHQATAIFNEASILLSYVNESSLDETYVGRLLIRARSFSDLTQLLWSSALPQVLSCTIFRLVSSDFVIPFSVHIWSFVRSRPRASSHRFCVLSNAANRPKFKDTRTTKLVSTIMSLKIGITVLIQKKMSKTLLLLDFHGIPREICLLKIYPLSLTWLKMLSSSREEGITEKESYDLSSHNGVSYSNSTRKSPKKAIVCKIVSWWFVWDRHY